MMTVAEWVERWSERAPAIPTDLLRELLDRLSEEEE
ncbi:hypothetical protein QBC98_004120 [Kitasatospora acidiphila]